ncbi:MAG: CinA family nicotinamide mononucleotide deamidase-related protein [Planctomycetota bacterium]|jgi:nicotinamide-nucleotide amidase
MKPPHTHIIVTGNELIRGDVNDENSPWLAKCLTALGFPVVSIRIVGDDPAAITACLENAVGARARLAVVTGGLGPTEDDRTRDAVASFTGSDLVLNEDLAGAVRAFMEGRGRSVTAGAMRQARLPAGASPMANPRGTAAGFHLQHMGMEIVVLPGPPAEMRATAGEDLSTLVKVLGLGGEFAAVARIDTFGLPEVDLDALLDPVRAIDGVTVATLAARGEVGVVLSSVGRGAGERVAIARAKAVSLLGDRVYGEGGEPLAAALVELLSLRGLTLALAESCTGGLAGHLVTAVPGASGVFQEGIVAYSNAAKERLLGVDRHLLESKGAVSGEVALEMARGAARNASADLGVGITGIAGPGGATEAKPVGLVYVAVSLKKISEVRSLHLGGLGRSWVKRLSALSALDLARRCILDSGE